MFGGPFPRPGTAGIIFLTVMTRPWDGFQGVAGSAGRGKAGFRGLARGAIPGG